ncbi:MAG: TolC family protein [Burkholderiales bacterium]
MLARHTIRFLFIALAATNAAHAASGPPLTMEEAVAIAEGRSARLSAQSAAVQVAGQMAARAGELPDPKLKFGLENVPVSGTDAWSLSRDFMTMKRIGVMQELVNGDKRRARADRATSERGVEQAVLRLEQANVARETAMAWYEVLHATRALEVVAEVVNAVQLQQETVRAAIAGGRASAADGFMVATAFEEARDEQIEQERVLARARIQLAQFIGADAERPIAAGPDTSRLSRPVEALLASLDAHPTLAVFDAREQLVKSDIALAHSTKKPDWGVELSYGQREPYYSNMLTLMFSVDLPVFAASRQDRDIAAQEAQLDRLRAQREDARRSYETLVRGYAVDWETWNRRVQRFETVLIPLAEERVKAASASYRGAKGTLDPVIEAKKREAETRMKLHNALLERGRAWSSLNFLVSKEAP